MDADWSLPHYVVLPAGLQQQMPYANWLASVNGLGCRDVPIKVIECLAGVSMYIEIIP